MKLFVIRCSLTMGLLMSGSAGAQYINGYAVANHRPCGNNNLPATITELDKFFASRYFPQDAQKNSYWKDGGVKAADWVASTDLFESPEAASGFDGMDAPLISYIASHGGTSNGKYTGLAGGSDGCYINSNTMAAGDGNARYLVLSTCQGLKIGTGDNPTRPGENPSVTWRTANKGLNCIFGYSNNMVDASEYGNYFLENLATSDETLAKAFMRASRRVSSSNLPAVLCFGTDDAAAREYLETTKRFSAEKIGTGGSAWTHGQAKRVEGVFDFSKLKTRKALARTVSSKDASLSAEKIATSFLGGKFQDQTATSSLKIYRTSSGTVTVNSENGYFSFVKASVSDKVVPEMKIDDSAAVRIGEAFIAGRSFLSKFVPELAASYVVDRFVGNEEGSSLVEKTVIFSQTIGGVAVLGTSGTLEVVIGANGEVSAVHGALLTIEKMRVAEWLDTKDINVDHAGQVALRNVAKKLENAKLTVVQTLIGYDSGDYSQRHNKLHMVAEVLVEATEGDFSRRYVERIAL